MSISVPDSNAANLGSVGMLSNDPVVKRTVFSLFKDNNVMSYMSLITRKNLVNMAVRWVGNLPQVHSAQINDNPTFTLGQPSPYAEQVYMYRDGLQIDTVLRENESNITDPLDAQLDAYFKDFTYVFNYDLFNNDHTIDVKRVLGFRYRLTVANLGQFGIPTDMCMDGYALTGNNLSMVASTVAGSPGVQIGYFEAMLDRMLNYVGDDDGTGIDLYMNDYLIRSWQLGLKTAGSGIGWSIDKDNYGRRVTKYRDARIVDPGRNQDQSGRVISATENSTGTAGSSTYTSVYAIKNGSEDCALIHWGPMKPIFDGVVPGTFIEVVKMQYIFGIWMPNNRSVARMYDVNIGSTPL